MGKASSSKKVARAAGTGGGRTNRGRTPWMYYMTIAVVAVLGIVGVYLSRQHRLQTISAAGKTEPPRAGQDHWHVAYGIYVCDSATTGHFLPPITDQTDPTGIHTHGDGVIHVHPYVDSSAGKNANLGKFASAVHMTLNAGELKVPNGHDYRDGDSCGGKPGRVQVQVWGNSSTQVGQVNQLATTPGTLSTVNPPDVRLFNNNLITIAFMPKGAKIPPPPPKSIYNLQHLNDVASPTPSTSTTAPGSSTSTTAPASSTTTTAPQSSTTSTSIKK
ncbi:MAG TPA: hypothetical protein VLL25_11755 [Acidimicrobiales bacterium]|nr:hypothetical protein [Acidimicrobiales bacterium]